MNNNKYWQNRLNKQQEKLYNKTLEQFRKKESALYREAARGVKNDIEQLYKKLVKDSADGEIKVNDLYKYRRYFVLLRNINRSLNSLGENSIKTTEIHLLQMYGYAIKSVAKYIKGNPAANSFTVGNDNGKDVIKSIWCSDGRHWSQRIWGNMRDLQKAVEKGLIDCVSRGASVRDMTKDIMGRFDVSFGRADTLARTELSHIQNIATLNGYIKAGATGYEWDSEGDSERTCDRCQAMNGKRFSFSEAKTGETLPPLHPCCRCGILATFD